MVGVATVVGAVSAARNDPESTEPAPHPLRAGTAQATLVNTLHDHRVSLEMLQQAWRLDALADIAVQATAAARAAETVANRIAHDLDAIDDALTRAGHIARDMVRPTQVLESVQRMKQRRRELLTGLTTAVEQIGEVYTKLLELSVTTDLLGMPTEEISEAGQVSRSLDVIRGVFADLDALDRSVGSGSGLDQSGD